jgi:hypothetical protein
LFHIEKIITWIQILSRSKIFTAVIMGFGLPRDAAVSLGIDIKNMAFPDAN